MLGYACINVELSSLPKKRRVMTNRGMIKRTFDAKGLSYAGELSLQNVRDLLTILEWNEDHGIRFFRVSSDLFPWMSHYELRDLPQFPFIKRALRRVGDYAMAKNHRLTFHPGPFNKLASPDSSVVAKTIKELDQHSEVFDLMGFDPSPYNKINIHVGGAYGNREETAKRFCELYNMLGPTTQKRLTVENDDKDALYSTRELYDMVYSEIGIPIVHDFHHHTFRTSGLSQDEAVRLAMSTWGDVRPVVHYSESRREEKNDPKIPGPAHSDYVKGPLPLEYEVDIMIEAKMKEKTLLEVHQ